MVLFLISVLLLVGSLTGMGEPRQNVSSPCEQMTDLPPGFHTAECVGVRLQESIGAILGVILLLCGLAGALGY